MSITGSGAHGIIATMPLYAAYKVQGYTKEQLLRATALSYLVCMYIKEYSGKLSAFCGCAIAAGTGNGQPPRPCRPAPAARRAFPASAPESPENRLRRARRGTPPPVRRRPLDSGANRPRRARRAPVWPQGGIESLGCTGRRLRPPLA